MDDWRVVKLFESLLMLSKPTISFFVQDLLKKNELLESLSGKERDSLERDILSFRVAFQDSEIGRARSCLFMDELGGK